MQRGRRVVPAWSIAALAAGGITILPGCALLHGFLDPTTVGSFRLDKSDTYTVGIRRVLSPRETPNDLAGATEPTADDLVPDYGDYRIGAGDQLAIVIDDLLAPGLQDTSVQEVSPTGFVRLPELGSVKVVGLTETELEHELKTQLQSSGKLPNPIVRAFVQVKRSKYFSIVGNVNAAGPYGLSDPDTRLLDAIATARDIDPNARKLFIIRREDAAQSKRPSESPTLPSPTRPEGLIIPPPTDEDDGARGSYSLSSFAKQDSQPAGGDSRQRQDLEDVIAPPRGQSRSEDQEPATRRGNEPFSPLIFDPETGQAVEVETERRADRPAAAPAPRTTVPPPEQPGFDWEQVPEFELSQRVIEIDVPALKKGDPRYNVVIRNRDVIQVPVDTGVFYLMGQINRPGVYALGGRDITIKQAIAIAGGFAPLAWPKSVEVVRKEGGSDKQIVLQVDLDRIFGGLDADFILKDDDVVNVGSNFVAPFLYVARNSFRFTYGFGFVYDRNFADQDAYSARQNPEALEQARRQSRGLPF
ncbi:MAG: polysaccharide biosynthesis/export family protein [Phycisphaerales bacterium]|nr:polysaccharide biosynthesis/export family protein [Phycisphaerales bacterium]